MCEEIYAYKKKVINSETTKKHIVIMAICEEIYNTKRKGTNGKCSTTVKRREEN